MTYGITSAAVVLLALVCWGFRRSSSNSDAIGLTVGMFMGFFVGMVYGLYLHQPHLVLSSDRWPMFVAMGVGSIVGMLTASYTRDRWSEPYSRLLQWIVPRVSRFKLKSLLALTTLLCLFLGLYKTDNLQQKRAVEQLRNRGVTVEYRSQENAARKTRLRRLMEWIGPDPFQPPYRVAGHEDELSDDGLAGLKQLHRVECLQFTNTTVTTNALSLLGSRAHLTRFSLLREKVLPFDDGAGLLLLSECEQLKSLSLENVELPRSGLIFLRDCPRLESLELNGMQIDDESLRQIAKCRSLCRLSLYGTATTDEGLECLHRLESLTQLNLGKTRLSDSGLQSIGKLKNLEHLTLSENKISDHGLKFLSELHQLKSLGLSSTNITDAGIVHLQTLKSLESVQLMGTRVTDEGLESLDRALPEWTAPKKPPTPLRGTVSTESPRTWL